MSEKKLGEMLQTAIIRRFMSPAQLSDFTEKYESHKLVKHSKVSTFTEKDRENALDYIQGKATAEEFLRNVRKAPTVTGKQSDHSANEMRADYYAARIIRKTQ